MKIKNDMKNLIYKFSNERKFYDEKIQRLENVIKDLEDEIQ